MLEGKTVAVVVPAHDEEALIDATLQGIPSFVDRIFVVDDASTDATAESVRAIDDPRVELIVHDAQPRRRRGDRHRLQARARARVPTRPRVMAGDNQMDPDELEALALPVVRGELDYAKANRLFTGSAWKLIPRSRYLGNAVAEPVHEGRIGLLAHRRLAGRVHGHLAARRCSCSTSTASTPRTGSRTTCSCT